MSPLTVSTPFIPMSSSPRIELFKSLKDTRRKLGDPRTHNAALKELRTLIGGGRGSGSAQGQGAGKA